MLRHRVVFWWSVAKSRLLDTVCLMVPNTSRHALPVPVRPRQSRFHQMRLSPPCAPLDYLRIPSLAARKLTPFPFALVAKLVHANVNMGISVARGGMDEVASITHGQRSSKAGLILTFAARPGRAGPVEWKVDARAAGSRDFGRVRALEGIEGDGCGA